MNPDQAILHITDLCEKYLNKEKSDEIKNSVKKAYEERDQVIVKFALAEIHQHGSTVKNRSDKELIKNLFFNFG